MLSISNILNALAAYRFAHANYFKHFRHAARFKRCKRFDSVNGFTCFTLNYPSATPTTELEIAKLPYHVNILKLPNI